MKKIIVIIVTCFCFQVINAQNIEELKIDIIFSNKTKLEVIKKLEEQTSYKFFYINDWLDSGLISGNYKNASLNKILDDIFKETDLNYFISSENRVILTKNNLIYDHLPNAFYNNKNQKANSPKDIEPVFYDDNIVSKIKKYETVRIGKETKTYSKKNYTLSGRIINSLTGEPIPNLAIVVLNKNINAVTDINGFYTIRLPSGINYVETKALGIEEANKKIIIYSDGILNFELNESSETLKEVIVEANRDRNIKEVISGVTQIKVQEIKNIPLVLGERDILKVATTLPGIKKAGEGSSGYNVRGGKEDQNLILLDNAVLYNPSHFFGIFSALNPFTSGDVNIYKGSLPAEFGGRLSSVFDIKTKDASTEKLKGEASIGPVTSNLTLEIPIVSGESSLLIGGRGTYSDWVLKAIDEESIKNSKASFYDFIGKYKHKIDKDNNLEASGYFSNDEFSITSDSIYKYNNRLLSLKWNRNFNNKNNGSLILANSEYKFNIGFDGDVDTDFDLDYKINETELKLKMKYLHSESHKFDYGISSKFYKVNPGNIKPMGNESIIQAKEIPEEKALESAIFIADNYKINKKLLLNIGLRYSFYASLGKTAQRKYLKGEPKNESSVVDTLYFDKNEVVKKYGGPEMRFSVRYFLAPSLSVKGSFNSTYQYIHTLSNNTTASPTDTWKLSDLNIEPQRANQFTLGFYKNFQDSYYELSLESYYKKTKNTLDYKVGADLLLNKYIETEVIQGEGEAYGVEFLMKKTRGNLNGWLGYSYSRSFVKLNGKSNEERVNNGDYFPSNYDKPHDFSLVANYKITKRYSFSANFTYQTGRPVTYPVGKYIYKGEEHVLYSDRNKFRIPDYYRFDIGFNIEGNHKLKKLAHSFWNISIYNVLGRNNPYSVYFVTDKGQIKAYQSSIFSVPVPTITYNFKF
ncbi:carboxypeptidase-like regulatory domain-containing protein [uncultured Lutibacter sp.]|uniref:TonB-dependent receptor n=1 Tax=uncultured Lutibacter sp. TaxID=437739 RepID=UPI00260DA727|nr:carboxypeptidase-like regulatory domain-containing protein [uncultured Lutibacter sp.]